METNTQKNEPKRTKAKSKPASKWVSIRIKIETKKAAVAFRDEANKKAFGRSIKLDEVIEVGVSQLTNQHIVELQEKSMTNKDRKDQLRQRYIEMRGPTTEDQFIGFMMTAAFQEFLKELEFGAGATPRITEVAALAG